jgi:hypothetical protein
VSGTVLNIQHIRHISNKICSYFMYQFLYRKSINFDLDFKQSGGFIPPIRINSFYIVPSVLNLIEICPLVSVVKNVVIWKHLRTRASE